MDDETKVEGVEVTEEVAAPVPAEEATEEVAAPEAADEEAAA